MGAARWARVCVASLTALALATSTAACSGSDSSSAAASKVPDRLGGPLPTKTSPPDVPMDHLEEPIARRLAGRVAAEGLTLEYVDCPRWSGSVPAVMRCEGYVDGVVGQVGVELTRAAGGGVEYDARLEEGVLATAVLVRRLEAEGYEDVDCGEAPAYPVRVGLRLVCEVEEDGETGYVEATVTDPSGEVEIKDY